MIVPLDIVLFLVLIATAVLALVVRDLLAAVALLAAYSLFAAILFAEVNALDVALVEAALGAGLTGVLFVAAILATSRRSAPRPDARRRIVVIPLIVAFVGLVFYASSGLPDRGDPEAPAQQGVSQHYLANSLAETETPNVVTALLADYRSQDTLGETMVIVTAALAASLVLVRRVDEPDQPTPQAPDTPGAGPGDDEAAPAGPSDADDAPLDDTRTSDTPAGGTQASATRASGDQGNGDQASASQAGGTQASGTQGSATRTSDEPTPGDDLPTAEAGDRPDADATAGPGNDVEAVRP